MKNMILILIAFFSISAQAEYYGTLIGLNNGGYISKMTFEVYQKGEPRVLVAKFQTGNLQVQRSEKFELYLPMPLDNYEIAYLNQAIMGVSCSGIGYFNKPGYFKLVGLGTMLDVICNTNTELNF